MIHREQDDSIQIHTYAYRKNSIAEQDFQFFFYITNHNYLRYLIVLFF